MCVLGGVRREPERVYRGHGVFSPWEAETVAGRPEHLPQARRGLLQGLFVLGMQSLSKACCNSERVLLLVGWGALLSLVCLGRDILSVVACQDM